MKHNQRKERQLISVSKYMSLILRHQPDQIGLRLDAHGWADVSELIRLSGKAGQGLTRELIDEVVATNDKKRFAFSSDRRKIRASQGHSVQVSLGLKPVPPPDILFHGTATKFLDAIFRTGLSPRSRQHVHLSPDHDTAVKVGRRHGKPVVLEVMSGAMHRRNYEFFLSENGVWLTAQVPVIYLRIRE